MSRLQAILSNTLSGAAAHLLTAKNSPVTPVQVCCQKASCSTVSVPASVEFGLSGDRQPIPRATLMLAVMQGMHQPIELSQAHLHACRLESQLSPLSIFLK